MHRLNKSIQYKGKYYKRNDKIKIDKKDLDEFIRRRLINEATESPVRAFKKDKVEVVKEEPKEPVSTQKTDYNEFTVIELKVMLDNEGIEYKSTDNKSDLIKLLRGE